MDYELIQLMADHGWDPRPVGMVELPFFSNGVPAGNPLDMGHDNMEMIDTWALMGSAEGCICTLARGDSMMPRIEDGDLMMVKVGHDFRDNDIVVARKGNDLTVKAYTEYPDGSKWLIPLNEKYDAIPMAGLEGWTIVGKVVSVVRNDLHTSARFNQNRIRKTMEKNVTPSATPSKTYNKKVITKALKAVQPLVKSSRQWYAVYRGMVDEHIIEPGNYDGFQSLLWQCMGEDTPILNLKDLQCRMDLDSFSKPVRMWDENRAPVQGRRFHEYKHIAVTFVRYLKE